MTKRNVVRLTAFAAALVVTVTAVTVTNAGRIKTYKNQLEVNYRQSLSELNESIDLINTDLNKSLYSNSQQELSVLSRDLFAQCSAAKRAAARLPLSQKETENIYKFLSQAGDYAQYISAKTARGEKVSENEHRTLKVLMKYANQLEKTTGEAVKLAESGVKITDTSLKLTGKDGLTPLSNGFSESAKTFESYPTLLYDGPFSEQVLNKDSALLKKAKEKSADECRKTAAKALDKNEKRLAFDGESKGRLPSCTFRSSRYTVLVTKRGGYVKSIMYSGKIGASNISTENAVQLAKKYLEKLGYKNMEQSYFSVNDNVCTVNFAYVEKNVYHYGDLIKVSVSMEDGALTAFDASTYLVNHVKRSPFKAKIKSGEAQKKLSPYLNVKGVKKCVIPKDDGREVQCWEFLATSRDTGEDALIYINADTGNEEDIMLMLYSDNGTLVK